MGPERISISLGGVLFDIFVFKEPERVIEIRKQSKRHRRLQNILNEEVNDEKVC